MRRDGSVSAGALARARWLGRLLFGSWLDEPARPELRGAATDTVAFPAPHRRSLPRFQARRSRRPRGPLYTAAALSVLLVLGPLAAQASSPGRPGAWSGPERGASLRGGITDALTQGGYDGPPTDRSAPTAEADGLFGTDGTLVKPVAVRGVVPSARERVRRYRARPGDALSQLAHAFTVSPMTLWWANAGLPDKDTIRIAQLLHVPPGTGIVHTVREGDSLASIARMYRVDATAIAAENALRGDVVVIGQQLFVPEGRGVPYQPRDPAEMAAERASRTETQVFAAPGGLGPALSGAEVTALPTVPDAPAIMPKHSGPEPVAVSSPYGSEAEPDAILFDQGQSYAGDGSGRALEPAAGPDHGPITVSANPTDPGAPTARMDPALRDDSLPSRSGLGLGAYLDPTVDAGTSYRPPRREDGVPDRRGGRDRPRIPVDPVPETPPARDVQVAEPDPTGRKADAPARRPDDASRSHDPRRSDDARRSDKVDGRAALGERLENLPQDSWSTEPPPGPILGTILQADHRSLNLTAQGARERGLVWPVAGRGRITQFFHDEHLGVDIAADAGTWIRASERGVVVFAGWRSNRGGNSVYLQHGGRLYTVYAHLSDIYVRSGERVKRGQKIARMGSTGFSTGPHLHYAVAIGPGVESPEYRANPFDYLVDPRDH